MKKKPNHESIKSITEQQAQELAIMLFTDKESPKKDRVTKDEISIGKIIRTAKKVSIEVSVRYFDGGIELYDNADIFLFNNDDELQAIRDQLKISSWVVSNFIIKL